MSIRIPCEKTAIINDIRIKNYIVHNLPENRDLLCYARKIQQPAMQTKKDEPAEKVKMS